MKKGIFLITLLSFQAFSQTKFELVVAQSRIVWKGSQVTGGSHVGTISPASGSLMLSADGVPVKGNFAIDMNSIKNNDVKPAKSAKELEDHLKSDDFFAADKFPNAFFTILKVAPSTTYPNKGNYAVTGILMIRGISNQLVFPCTMAISNGIAEVKAELQFNRTKWDILYHSASFFASVKDELISDLIGVSLDLTFVEKK